MFSFRDFFLRPSEYFCFSSITLSAIYHDHTVITDIVSFLCLCHLGILTVLYAKSMLGLGG